MECVMIYLVTGGFNVALTLSLILTFPPFIKTIMYFSPHFGFKTSFIAKICHAVVLLYCYEATGNILWNKGMGMGAGWGGAVGGPE